MSQGKGPSYGVRMPPEARAFYVLNNVLTCSGLTQTPVKWVQGSLHGSNTARAKADNSTALSNEDKDGWTLKLSRTVAP